jgi:hypothetical protein
MARHRKLWSFAFGLMLAAAGGTAAVAQTMPANGPAYAGQPNLPVAVSFIDAGGGAGGFSSVRALSSVVGPSALQSELQKLASEYGPGARDRFVKLFDFAINDAWMRAGTHDLHMPPPNGEGGRMLGVALIRTGTAPNGQFWSGYFFDHLLSQRVSNDVMSDLDARYGPGSAAQFLRMANQFFYDLSQHLGTAVALAPVH